MKSRLFFFSAGLALLTGCHIMPTPKNSSRRPPVKLGVEVLFEQRLDLIRGRHVGLITNPTGCDRQLASIIDRFRAQPDVTLTALYGPEHGVRGDAQAGEYVPFYFDQHYQLPVFSLYGQTHKPPADMMTNIDEYMRTFDTKHEGKQVETGMMQSVDVMVFDMQDVGTRVYTYIATMAYAMQAAADADIPFIVLDRPNPVNGVAMEGPILEYPKYSSFIGLYPIPLRHGMTVGELARLFNEKFSGRKNAGSRSCRWKIGRATSGSMKRRCRGCCPRRICRRRTARRFIPARFSLEGTNLSEGRGTTKPFELFGAPWIDGFMLARKLNALNLPGVKFREVWFTPTFSKFSGQQCGGCQLHVTDRDAYQPVATTLAILSVVRQPMAANWSCTPAILTM